MGEREEIDSRYFVFSFGIQPTIRIFCERIPFFCLATDDLVTRPLFLGVASEEQKK